jgi:Outer membrane lipoprotein
MKSPLKTFFQLTLVGALVLPLSNCTRNIQAGTYASSHVGETMTSYVGTLIAKRAVEVAEAERMQDNVLGMGAGGIAGGVIGHQIGKGRGNALATLGGAAAGALAGSVIQNELGKQQGLEYTVQLDNGTLKTVVQGMDVNLNVGQRVILHEGRRGRSRIVPLVQ